MLFAVLDYRTKKCVGSYLSDVIKYISPYDDMINQVHIEVTEGNYAEGYYIGEDANVLYNHSYTPPVSKPELLTEMKLESITNYYVEEARKFAAMNSILMYSLGYTTEQKQAFVSKAKASFKPIADDIELYAYYDIWDMFDAIVRDEILTEERISTMKNNLYAEIFS